MTSETFLYLILNLFSLYQMKLYFDIFFKTSRKSVKTVAIWTISIIWQIISTFLISDNGVVNLLISIFMILFYTLGLYEGTLYKKIIFVMLFNVIYMLAEVLTALILIYSGFGFVENSFLGVLVSKLLMFIVIKSIDFWGRKRTFGEIAHLTGGLMIAIPLGSIYIACYIFYSDYKLYGSNISIIQTIPYIIILIVNIIIFVLYERIFMEQELRRSNSIYEKQIESFRQNALIHRQISEEVRKIRHDIKYQIFYIQNALEKKKYNEAQEFLAELNYLTKIKVDKYLDTSNLIVDSLINYEYSLAKAVGIDFSANVEIGSELSIEDGDICLLLGNIIDNAIEASEKVDISNRFIKLYMKEMKNTLTLVVQNSFINSLEKDWMGRYISSKKNKFYHGVGLSTIERIVNKYNGTFMIDTKEQIFTLKIMMFMGE